MSTETERAETELLGHLLACQTPSDVRDIVFYVPAEAFSRNLDRAIVQTVTALADQGVAGDQATIVQTVLLAGLWPRDCHHEVTARVVDAITCGHDPLDWCRPAKQVLDGHARRITARRLAQLATRLPSCRLAEVTAGLFELAEFVEIVVGWSEAVSPEVTAA